MCGISGVTGTTDVVAILYESIRRLEYRGYDSCGLGVVSHGEVAVRKNVGGVEEVNQREHLTAMHGNTGIAHTRWATHGKVTQLNAHPHVSMDGRFSIVHNGIINNYLELRSELKARGVPFVSETDTEVMAHLVALAYAEFGNVEDAFLAAVRRLEGSYAFCMVTSADPEAIYCARAGSPLVLGLSKQRQFVASDVNAFLTHTREALLMEDGEYAVVRPAGVVLRRIADRSEVRRTPMHVEWDAETSRKGGYAHYMLKEIFEQPQTLLNALNVPRPEIEKYAQLVQEARQTYLMGVGTTHYVALTGQYFFSQLTGRLLAAVSADEFEDLAVIGPSDLLISISQSGETYDTRRAAAFAKARGARTASIVNVMGSSLSMMTDEVILQGSGPEICVVSTKAALAQMVILLRVALELGRRSGPIDSARYKATYRELEAFPALVQTTLNERSGMVRNLADRVVQYRNWLVLGRGIYYPVSLEAALKMKEVTYLHVEGMPAGFLKHGTLALVDETMLSLFLLPPVQLHTLHEQTLSALEEVKARGGPVVGFVFEDDERGKALIPDRIELPVVPPSVAPLLSLIVAQLFAYFAALKLGRSIDKPRNLAKSVTVG
jgi:glucosamine--fructose-6-phosphate aminotransferase (isomerizing)